ncbi:MAG TPA: response regulator [Pirellulales bacterium]|nr:response regulator [Pirellulales bacterium]
MLVEDDPDDEELFRLALAHANVDCRVEVVSNGEALLGRLFGSGAHGTSDKKPDPDLILLDLKLPKLSGLQVLRVLKNTAHGTEAVTCPIVVFTSSDDEKDIATSYGLGALSYVRKPVSHGRFMETVQETVLYWLNINEPVPRHGSRAAMPDIEHAVGGI